MNKDDNRFSFSKERLSTLPLPKKGQRSTYHDTKAIGLQLRVSSTGTKTFSVFRRLKGGEPERVTLGKFPAMTVEQARKSAAQVNAEIESGASPAAAKRAIRGEPTFAEAFAEFLENRRKKNGEPLAERTKSDYRDIVERYLSSIKAKKLSQIEKAEVRKLHAKISKTSPVKANHALLVVSGVFSYMIDSEAFTGPNPARGIKTNAVKHRDRFARGHELPYLFAAIGESEQRDYFLLSLLTGARRSNVQAMAWRDIDLNAGVWRIERTKNGTPQNVALSPEAVMVLKARREAAEEAHKVREDKADGMSPFVFPGCGASGHLVEPKRAWATILLRAHLSRLLNQLQAANAIDVEAAQLLANEIRAQPAKTKKVILQKAIANGLNPSEYELEDLRIHDLRRTLGSWQASTGSSLAIIGKSLNHKTPQATMIYARLDLDPVRQSVNTATAAMLEAAGLKASAEVISLSKNGKA